MDAACDGHFLDPRWLQENSDEQFASSYFWLKANKPLIHLQDYTPLNTS